MDTNQGKPTTPFQRRLAELGDDNAASMLGVAPRTVKSWRLGDRTPRPQQAPQIIEKMSVTWDDIYRVGEAA